MFSCNFPIVIDQNIYMVDNVHTMKSICLAVSVSKLKEV